MENNGNTPDGAAAFGQQDGGANANPPAGAGKKNMRWLWIVLAALIVCGAVVGVLFATGVLGAAGGNAGVLALCQYYRDKQERMDSMMTEDQKAVKEAFLNGPFEVDLDMDMKTDALSSTLPIDSIPVEMEMKYDMKDLGLKTSIPGFEMLGASIELYLIEDEIIVSSLGGVERTEIETPTDADIDEQMPIGDRIKALLPFLPQDEQTVKDIVMQLAMAVPDEYTETGRDEVYSPLADDDIEVDSITTTLDKEALGEVITRLESNLQKEDELMDTLQGMIDAFTDMFELGDVELDDELEDLADEVDKIPDIEISWSVYSKNGTYIGVSLIVVDENMNEQTYTEICEISGSDMYQWASLNFENLDQTMDVDISNLEETVLVHCVYDGNAFTIDENVEANMTSTSYPDEELTMTATLEGEGELVKLMDDRYELAMDISMQTVNMQGLQGGVEGDMEVDFTLECEFRFGDDLGMLEDSDDWNAAYDEDWQGNGSLFDGADLFGDLM